MAMMASATANSGASVSMSRRYSPIQKASAAMDESRPASPCRKRRNSVESAAKALIALKLSMTMTPGSSSLSSVSTRATRASMPSVTSAVPRSS